MGWGRPRPVPPGPPADAPVPFDALIDIDVTGLRPGVTALNASDAVTAAVIRLPGANWINVQPHPTPGQVSARLHPVGSSLQPQDEIWMMLRLRVEDAARQALLGLLAPKAALPPFAQPDLATAGFGEAPSALQLDALRQLADLAQLARPLPPVPKSCPPPDGVALLEHLLGFVLPASAHSTATAAITRLGSYAAVLAAPEAELRAVPGLGTHSIAAIKLVHAAAVRLARAGLAQRPVLDDWTRLVRYLAAALARERIEQFRILFLDAGGMLLADEVQARGTVNHTPVYPREVVRRARELGAAALILVHNHPSGDPTPSRDDLEMTRKVSAAARVLSITVRDHVIVGNGRTLSFQQAGLLT